MKYFRQAACRSLVLGVILSYLIVLGSASYVYANGLPAGIAFFPGLAPLDLICGPLLTVAVAIIERPYFARSGLTPWALLHSLRANFASYLMGFVVAMVYLSIIQAFANVNRDTGELFLLGLPVLLIVFTIWFEERLAVLVLAQGTPVRRRWIVIGNIVSNLALFGIAILIGVITEVMGIAVHPFVLSLEKWTVAFVVAYLVIFGGAILLAFGVPLWSALPKNIQRQLGIPDLGQLPEMADGPSGTAPPAEIEEVLQVGTIDTG